MEEEFDDTQEAPIHWGDTEFGQYAGCALVICAWVLFYYVISH